MDSSDGEDQALGDLLRSVREIRTTLAIDLAAAAGALEAGRPEIARDIVSATADEVASIGTRTREPRIPQVTARHHNRRRLLLALPAVPLLGAIAMTTAAAIGGGTPSRAPADHSTTAAHRSVVAAQVPTTAAEHEAATTTLRRLEHVVADDPRAAQVLALADDLHEQLTAMIATSTDNPARLHVVRRLLTLEQHVLETSKVPGTQLALAASREVARLLDLAPTATRTSPSLPVNASSHHAASAQPTATPSHASTATPSPRPTNAKSTTTARTPSSTPPSRLFGRGVFGRH